MTRAFALRERTPAGRGAVRVLELAGPGAAAFLRALARKDPPEPGALRLVRLVDGADELDEALLLALGPEQFELHVSGSPPLVRRVCALAAQAGAAPAPESAAASAEARARELLVCAESDAAARVLLDQAEGALRRELEALAGASSTLRRAGLKELGRRGEVARRLLEPARVVIAGAVNAGKSTLFNALLGEERALVHAQAGTTRDVLRERALLGDYPVWLFDTAGERASAAGTDPVERAGQQRARELQHAADFVLWLAPVEPAGDGQAALEPLVPALTRRFASRAPPGWQTRADALAAREDPSGARARVAAAFRAHFELPERAWTPGAGVPCEPRQIAGLRSLDPELDERGWRVALERLLGPQDKD